MILVWFWIWELVFSFNVTVWNVEYCSYYYTIQIRCYIIYEYWMYDSNYRFVFQFLSISLIYWSLNFRISYVSQDLADENFKNFGTTSK